MKLGHGYKPAFTISRTREAVVRWLVDHPEWQQRIHQFEGGAGLAGESCSLGRLASNLTKRAGLLPSRTGIGCWRVANNVAERDARNRALGRSGERLALEHERRSLRSA